VKNAFATIAQKYGKLDAVVASAGIVENYSALE
jgi:NAD(P)-dependent dehydrogenase (short-subunit alcohol dehydrogenase family)